MTNGIEITSAWAKITYFVTFDFDPLKLNKLYFAQYPRFCSEIFTIDVDIIDCLINNRILKLFNIIKHL